jgi:hypothetical protein
MATCSLCPPGSPDIPDREFDEHRRVVHPESGEDRTLHVGDSHIVRDASDEPAQEDGDEWHH